MQSIVDTANVETVQACPIGSTLLSMAGKSKSHTPSPLTILSVDDNEDLQYVMGLTLGLMGFNVISCSDADSASAAFQSRNDIDLLITDLEMPGRSGVELARELCGLCSSLPVLVVSGAYLSDDLTREMKERGWQFLAKPYALPNFSANVHGLLSTRTHQQHAA